MDLIWTTTFVAVEVLIVAGLILPVVSNCLRSKAETEESDSESVSESDSEEEDLDPKTVDNFTNNAIDLIYKLQPMIDKFGLPEERKAYINKLYITLDKIVKEYEDSE